mmetsp:Transcript_6245/g.7912  ORF Transcript_6245/g.7912 Transcript_6245/m.7912 type:complete len:215 (+) Transcript_6245:148-792(+)
MYPYEYFETKELPKSFGVSLSFWIMAYVGSYIHDPKNKDHFGENPYLMSLNSIVGPFLAALSLYYSDEETFSEIIILSWFSAFFIVDLVDCFIRKDFVFSFHAIISLVLVSVNCTPKYYDLRIASKGSFTELSTPFLHKWKMSKKKRDFQVFAVIFFFCRLVWTPIFVTQAFQILDYDYYVLGATAAFYILQLGFFGKIVSLLMNYKDKKDKKE